MLTFTAQITNLPTYMKQAKFLRKNYQLRENTMFSKLIILGRYKPARQLALQSTKLKSW